jgi:cobaltochelatase CobS
MEITSLKKIECRICDAQVHSIDLHLKKEHPAWTAERYQAEYPEAPMLSELAQRKVEEARAKKVAEVKEKMEPISKLPLHEIFGIGKKVKAALNARGEPIPVSVLTFCEDPEMIPDVDSGHVYDLENLKNCLMAIELNMPLYVWGHAGTGKTTLIEQLCAHTRRPMLRVQHTANTEESHIIGQWTAINGQTKFELGPLALAMKRGWVYLADEYDFAMPSVLAVYQPVLEGKALVIKEADEANRVIRPHPNFRFVATGNTNGSGDETGLYQGTAIQNAANYDRYGMVIQMVYMNPQLESRILVNQSGITEEDAKKIVEFATRVRENYDGSKLSNTISPRTLINVAKLGQRRGSYRMGITMSFTNKLSRVDREVVDQLAQRIFG